MKLLLILLAISLCYAFRFNPMSQSIELGENQKTAQFLIENESNESMPIELSVRTRVMDENGKEELPKVKDLTIFPPQMIIPPKEKRTIRVTYNGDKNIKTELAYRVIAEQLPLSVDSKVKKKSGIQMLMRYMAALYVTPKDAASDLSASMKTVTNNRVTFTVTNKGSRHQILLNPVVHFKKGDKKWAIKAKDEKGFSGENVLAGSTRTFSISVKENIPQDASVSLKIDEL